MNLAIKCDEMGLWEEYGVKIIGVDIDAIEITENREAFRDLMEQIDIPMAPQAPARSTARSQVRFATKMSEVPAAARDLTVPSAISPAPSTNTVRPRSPPRVCVARATAA